MVFFASTGIAMADEMTINGQVIQGEEAMPASHTPVMVFLPNDSIMVHTMTDGAGNFEVQLEAPNGYQGDVIAQVFDWCSFTNLEEVFPFVNGDMITLTFHICPDGGNGGGGGGNDCHANFHWEPVGGLEVMFWDESWAEDIDEWTWDFGDGTTGTGEEIVHEYTTPGQYQVTLTISGDDCSDSKTKNVHVMDSIPPQPGCQAMFGYEMEEGLTLQFIDLSWGEDIEDYSWDFGDGNTSDEQEPEHTYAEQGMYIVSLTISGDECASSIEMPVHVMDSVWPPQGCHANFHWERIENLTVQFFDASHGQDIEDYLWDFGDGSTSEEMNPIHVYAEEGMYDVTLTIFGDECQDMKTKNVNVHNCQPPQGCMAMFMYEYTDDPLQLQFIDLSMGDVAAWNWNFGDSTTSTEQNPMHTFAEEGMYMVMLEISGDSCNSVVEMPVFVGDSIWPPHGNNCHANFHWEVEDNLTVEFENASQGDDIDTYFWEFGDGTTSDEENPEHIYAEEGVYEVMLTISGDECSDTKFKHVHVGENWPNNNCHAMFFPEYISENTIAFYDMSMGDIEQWNWNFGDNQTSTEQNPEHTYADAGMYYVTLTILGDECVDSLMMEIIVDEPWNNNPCEALFLPEFTNALEVTFHDMSIGEIESWSWNFGDGTASYEQNPVHTYEQVGTYLVTLAIQTTDGCSHVYHVEINLEEMSYSALHSSTGATGIEEQLNVTNVNVYPNPVGDMMNVTFKAENDNDITLVVMSAMGQQVISASYSANAASNHIEVNTANLERGIYIMQLHSADGSVATHKFIK